MVLNYEAEIEMLLFDEEKIVSYKEISNRFDITPQEAQRVLDGFVKKKKESKAKDQIFVTYLLITKHEKGTKIQLINEEDLDKNQDTIVSKQIYSLQNKQIDDFNLIYSSDLDASSNIYRKSNLSVVRKEEVQHGTDAIILAETSNTLKSNKVAANKTTETTTTAAAAKAVVSTVASSKATEKVCASQEKAVPPAQKENAKVKTESKVKEEPKQQEDDDDHVQKKKTKLGGGVEEVAKKPAPVAGKKADPKKATNQASITSFFKKS